MSSIAEVFGQGKRNWMWAVLFGLAVLFAVFLSTPRLRPSQLSPGEMREFAPAGDTDGARIQLLLSASNPAQANESATAKANPALTAIFERKMIRTGWLEAVVKSPAESAEKIRRLAEKMGGYVESAQISGSQDSGTATVTMRVPAARFEDAKAGIRKLAVHVESEKTEATDVTKKYVDTEARIRNLRAEEAQYLTIMKSAGKVPDLLAVSEKLSEVRGEIEEQQAEFATLSKQVETVAITISLRSEAKPVVPVIPALSWRPLYQLRLAAHGSLENLGEYGSTMLAVLLQIPVVLLWLTTLILAAAGGWRGARWVWRTFFNFPKPVVAPEKAAQ